MQELLDGMHVESIPEFAIRARAHEFDPGAVKMYTAVRAVWTLWQRGRLGLMRDFEVDTDTLAAQFQAYDDAGSMATRVYLTRDDQVSNMLASLTEDARGELVLAALTMNSIYSKLYAYEYQEHVNRVKTNQPVKNKKNRRRRRTA